MKKTKSALAILISLCMLCALLPVSALSTEKVAHVHDEDCGYVAAKEAQPCAHVDEDICVDEGICLHEDDCGYAAAVDKQPCNHNSSDIPPSGNMAQEEEEKKQEKTEVTEKTEEKTDETGVTEKTEEVASANKLTRSTRSTTATLGDFSVTTTSGTAPTYGSNTLTFSSGGTYTVAMASGAPATTDKIVVNSSADITITLAGVNIDVSPAGGAAMDITGNGAATVKLSGENTLKSGSTYAGLQKTNTGATLTITSDSLNNSLTAKGGDSGSGIGGGSSGSGSGITISGGTVTATSGDSAAGIGGGSGGRGTYITISGTADVTANGGSGGAGIGGGSYTGEGQNGDGMNITITGGSVKATGTNGGKGIGSGKDNQGGSSGFSTTDKTTGKPGNAFIDASSIGDNGDTTGWSGVIFEGNAGKVYGKPVLSTDATIPSGKTLEILSGSTLTIGKGVTFTSNGTVTNSGEIINDGKIIGTIEGTGTVGGGGTVVNKLDLKTGAITLGGTIGNLTYTQVNGDSNKPYTGEIVITQSDSANSTTANTITVSGGNHTIILDGVNIDIATSANEAAMNITGGGAVTVKLSGENTLKSGSASAGLQKANTVLLTITGDGSLTATGNGGGAGIGGGIGKAGTNITINGGTVKATGGGSGAGIGGGNGGNGTNIKITGGDVRSNGHMAAGIGGGNGGDGTDITITGGKVEAYANTSGAGIGGGGGTGGSNSGTNITISGGTVVANGANTGKGIGGGVGGSASGFSTTDKTTGKPGNAFIDASSIGDTSGNGSWSGVIFDGNEGNVYGSPTLITDATIASGKTLNIPSGSTLTIGTGVTLTIDGTLLNVGNFVHKGKIVNSGLITDTGSYSGNGTVTNEPNSTITPKVYFTTQPQSTTVEPGGAVSLTVAAKMSFAQSSGSFTYQWKQGEEDISGAESSTYSFNAPDAPGEYNYKCVVSSIAGNSNISNMATVTVQGGNPPAPPDPSTTFYVHFNGNGGVGSMASQGFLPLLSQPLTPNTFTREGYKFIGWNTASDGSGASFADGNQMLLAENITLYAQWEKIIQVVEPIDPPKPDEPVDMLEDLTMGFKGEYAQLTSISLNGVALTVTPTGATTGDLSGYGDYKGVIGTVRSGSVYVTFYMEFLATLPSGKHNLSVGFKDGEQESAGSVAFTVENPENPSDPENPDNPDKPSDPSNPDNPNDPSNPSDPSNPDNPNDPSNPSDPNSPSTSGSTNSGNPATSDSTNVLLWLSLMGASLAGFIFVSKAKRKKS